MLTERVKKTKKRTGVSFTSVNIAPTKACISLQPSQQSATRALCLFGCRTQTPFKRSMFFFSWRQKSVTAVGLFFRSGHP